MEVYFDNAATTPLSEEVLDAMLPYMKENYGNPSSIHSRGRVTRTAIENARKAVAGHLSTSPAEIFFTSGGTESNNMALRCAVKDLNVKTIISSRIEHHCILHTLEDIDQCEEVKVKYVNIDKDGHINLDHLEELLKRSGKNTLVSLMHANNEIGNLLNLNKVSTLCEQYKAYFHSDTVQTVGHYNINLQKTKVHFITGSAHKFHGPKGCGFLYINPELNIKPLIYGGAQERNMRAGTENVYGIVGLGKAMEIAYHNLQDDLNKVTAIKEYMIQKLEKELPGVSFNGDHKGKSLYTVLNVALPSTEGGELLLFNLDIAGICASGGSACSSGSDIGSHVLRELGKDPEQPSVRFSFSKYNTKEEVDFTVQKLKEILAVEETA